MKNTKILVSSKKIEEYPGDLLVAFVSLDTQGKYCGHDMLQPLLDSLAPFKEFSGKKDEFLQLYLPFNSLTQAIRCRRLLLIGLGKIDDVLSTHVQYELLRSAGGIVAGQCKKLNAVRIGVCIPNVQNVTVFTITECLLEGILLGDYRFLKYKTKKKEEDEYSGIGTIELMNVPRSKAVRFSIAKASHGASAVITARDMANEPGNGWTPAHFADYAKDLAGRLDLFCTIFDKKDMIDLGMGGILAVNQGSTEAPRVIILEYSPQKKGQTVLLVGKGLTFDSGGVSLKPAQGMMEMKYDMCGGAAVLAAMETVGREKPPVRVIAIVPATDNMIGGGALKPGDVIAHYGGITSEIESTDAEGRLILADALAYGIEKYQPDCIVDIATLTGSVIMALGHHYAGLLSNNDQLAEKLLEVSLVCGEPVWRLPLGEMYAKQIKSQVADIKNTGGKPAGCITAGEYLHQFVGNTPWAHLDIAGTAWNFTEKTYIPKGPSGFGVRLLVEFLRRWEGVGPFTADS